MRQQEYLESLIPPELAGMRLDQALARLFPEYSRSLLQRWIRDGLVLVDQRQPRPRDAVAAGQRVAVHAVMEAQLEVQPQPIPLAVTYEDSALLVINKPAGMVVHPGAGNRSGTLQNALLDHAPELVRVPRGGLVHRLDKDTSGLLVVARTVEAHTRLVEAIQARKVEREYIAVTVGVLTAGGSVDAPIARHRIDRVRMAVSESGRRAVTHYRVIERFRAHSQLAVKLETGRTHQIRVHLAHIRHPLIGDPVYGRRLLLPKGATPELIEVLQGFRRQALHAQRLRFEHPQTGESLDLEAPLPEDMKVLLAALARDARRANTG